MPVGTLKAPRACDPRQDELLADYRERVRAAFGDALLRIVLFGSRARGEARRDSDWDLAVFLRRPPGQADEARLRALSAELGEAWGADPVAGVRRGALAGAGRARLQHP